MSCAAARASSASACAWSILSTLAGERLFGALFGGERGGFVKILRAHGSVGEDRHLIGLHLERAAADVDRVLAVGRLHAHFARLQKSEERRMPRRDPEFPFAAGREHHLGGARENLALGADDVDLNGVRFGHYCSVFAFSTASSMPPTM